MKEQSRLKRFIVNILKIFWGYETPREISDKNKAEMCKRAIDSCVCPHSCDTCAWSTLR